MSSIPNPLNHEDLKRLAEELGRPLYTLFALAQVNDPFIADMPFRRIRADWIAVLWPLLGFRRAHWRRIHYRLISRAERGIMPDGSRYVTTPECFQALGEALRDARYLRLIDAEDVEDKRNAEAIVNHPDEQEATADIAATAGGVASAITVDAPKLYVNAPIIPQRFHLELFAEKSTVDDIIVPLGRECGMNVLSGTGDVSLTRCYDLINRVKASGLPVRVICVVDFDRSPATPCR